MKKSGSKGFFLSTLWRAHLSLPAKSLLSVVVVSLSIWWCPLTYADGPSLIINAAQQHDLIAKADSQSKPLMLSPSLEQLLAHAIAKAAGISTNGLEVKIETLNPPLVINSSSTQVQILNFPLTGIAPRMNLRCIVKDERQTLGPFLIGVSIAIWREVYITTRNIKRGEPLLLSDLETKVCNVLYQPGALENLPTNLSLYEAAVNIPKGTVLKRDMIRPKPLIAKGQILKGVYLDGALRIELKVQALEEGTVGQIIRIKALQTNRELKGVVKNEELVEIVL